MKLFVVMLMISLVASAQNAASATEGPMFDEVGHLSSYRYADGTMDSYVYDSQGRMVRFIDRSGKIRVFSYAADGSMTVIEPDGTEKRG